MTALKVVDASAVAAILFDEPKAQDILECLDDARLVAPMLLSFELADICVVKSRRATDQRETLLEAMALRAGFDIEELPVDSAAVVTLALEAKLTAYDASGREQAFGLENFTGMPLAAKSEAPSRR